MFIVASFQYLRPYTLAMVKRHQNLEKKIIYLLRLYKSQPTEQPTDF